MGKLMDMKYEDLLQFKKTLKEQLRLVESKLGHVQQVLDNNYEANCYACEQTDFGYDELPKGWGWLVDNKYPVLLCDKCITKWEDRWVMCKTTRGEL